MKNLKISIFIAIVCVIAAITAVSFLGDKTAPARKSVFGSMPKDIRKITVASTLDSFDIALDDGYWKVPQAGNYYANSVILKYLFDSFKTARLTQKVDIAPEEIDLINIKIYSRDNRLLSDVDIFGEIENKYARVDGSTYLVSNLFNLPDDKPSWLEQPVVDIAEEFVQAVEANGLKTFRNDYFKPFQGDISFLSNQDLFKAISFLPFTDVMKKESFPTDSLKKNHIVITGFDGLITDLTAYTDGTDYWVEKKIYPAAITKKGVNEYIKSREFLYDGWIFKINPIHGKGLIDYTSFEERKK